MTVTHVSRVTLDALRRGISDIDCDEEEVVPALCDSCGEPVGNEHTRWDDGDHCLSDSCQPCCSTDGRHFGYTRYSPCPSCRWEQEHPDLADAL